MTHEVSPYVFISMTQTTAKLLGIERHWQTRGKRNEYVTCAVMSLWPLFRLYDNVGFKITILSHNMYYG